MRAVTVEEEYEKRKQKVRKLYEEIQAMKVVTVEEKERRKEKIRIFNKENKVLRTLSRIKVATEHGDLCEECGKGWIRNGSCSNPNCSRHDPEKERRRPSPLDKLRYCEKCHHYYYGEDDFNAHLPCSG
jgi:hypothetical protein